MPVNKQKSASQSRSKLGKHWHRMKTHLTGDDAQLEEAPDLARWDSDGQQSHWELSLREHLLSSPPLAIVDDGAGQASGSTVGKGDSLQNSLKN
jgi:hypothetical protein